MLLRVIIAAWNTVILSWAAAAELVLHLAGQAYAFAILAAAFAWLASTVRMRMAADTAKVYNLSQRVDSMLPLAGGTISGDLTVLGATGLHGNLFVLGNLAGQSGTLPCVDQLTAIQPGSSPGVAETWHAITTDSGWSTPAGYSVPQYRLLPDGSLQLAGCSNAGSSQTSNKTLNNSNPLPSAYRPNNTRLFRAWNSQGSRGTVQIDSNGVITMLANASYPGQYCEIDAVLKIN